jgi:hypothetical protein
MDYIIAGVIVLVCIVAIILGFRVYQESRKLGPKETDKEEDGTRFQS